jgi:hypothetical protein
MALCTIRFEARGTEPSLLPQYAGFVLFQELLLVLELGAGRISVILAKEAMQAARDTETGGALLVVAGDGTVRAVLFWRQEVV